MWSAKRSRSSRFILNYSIGHKMSKPGERNKLNEDHGRRQSSSKLSVFSSSVMSVSGIASNPPFSTTYCLCANINLCHVRIVKRTFCICHLFVRFGERNGEQPYYLQFGRETKSSLEKLQVDYWPSVEKGIAQTVSLRWTALQRAGERNEPLQRIHRPVYCGAEWI